MAHNVSRSQFDIMHPLFEAMRESKLPSTQRLLLLGLFRFIDGNGVCYPSYSALSEETGLSRQTIATTIKKLVNSGWITYQQGDKSKSMSNLYRFNLSKLGMTVSSKSKVVPLKPTWMAPDGSEWDSPTHYYTERQN